MRKRARGPASWLDLAKLGMPRDPRKLVYEKLTANDKLAVMHAHCIGRDWPDLCDFFASKPHLSVPDSFYDRCADQGHWNLLRWFIAECDIGTVLSTYVIRCAVSTGDLRLIQWILVMARHDAGLAFVAECAVVSGQLNVLQWAIDVSFDPPSPDLCYFALHEGNMAVIEWLFHTRGCPFKSEYLDAIVLGKGFLHVLEWLKKMGHLCEKDYKTMFRLAYQFDLPRLAKWCIDNGQTRYMCERILLVGEPMRAWADAHGLEYRDYIEPTGDGDWDWIVQSPSSDESE
jgi:hypothetical protein